MAYQQGMGGRRMNTGLGTWSQEREQVNGVHFWLVVCMWCFSGGSVVKNLPAMQEMRVRSLGQENPLEKGMATHSSILAWRIPGTEELGRLQSMGSQNSWTQLSD